MPELPDVELYCHKINETYGGTELKSIRLLNPFVLRTVEPSPGSLENKTLLRASRLGKRVVLEFGDNGPFIVVHLMIAGRFQFKPSGSKPPGRISLAVFEMEKGAIVLTEASKKRRASIHIVADRDELSHLDPGGIDVLSASSAEFSEQIKRENKTLKRALTSPRMFSGIGNAYSDEILHRAKLSPVRLTSSLSDDECRDLLLAAQSTLIEWRNRLIKEFEGRFPGPGDVTAFRPDFAVHGKYGEPCPVCGHKVQRITYAENETNYCAHCQNEGRLLADRSLSRLLKSDWPKKLEDLDSD